MQLPGFKLEQRKQLKLLSFSSPCTCFQLVLLADMLPMYVSGTLSERLTLSDLDTNSGTWDSNINLLALLLPCIYHDHSTILSLIIHANFEILNYYLHLIFLSSYQHFPLHAPVAGCVYPLVQLAESRLEKTWSPDGRDTKSVNNLAQTQHH